MSAKLYKIYPVCHGLAQTGKHVIKRVYPYLFQEKTYLVASKELADLQEKLKS